MKRMPLGPSWRVLIDGLVVKLIPALGTMCVGEKERVPWREAYTSRAEKMSKAIPVWDEGKYVGDGSTVTLVDR